MVLFLVTSAILEVTSAVVYFVADKTVKGIGRIIWPDPEKKIEYDNTYLLISEVGDNEIAVKDELSQLKGELAEIKKLLRDKN